MDEEFAKPLPSGDETGLTAATASGDTAGPLLFLIALGLTAGAMAAGLAWPLLASAMRGM